MDDIKLIGLVAEHDRLLAKKSSVKSKVVELPDVIQRSFDRVFEKNKHMENVVSLDFTPRTLFSYHLQNAASDQETPWYLKAPQIEWNDGSNTLTFCFTADAHSDNISVEVAAVSETPEEKHMITALRDGKRFGIYSGELLLATFNVEEDDFDIGLYAEGKVDEQYASIGNTLEVKTLPNS